MSLQLRYRVGLLVFLFTAFVFAGSLAAPRATAAAGPPTGYQLAHTLNAALEDPTDGMRLSVDTHALPGCRAADGSRGCHGRDTHTIDNLTWDTVKPVAEIGDFRPAGVGSNQPTRSPQ